MTQKPYCETQDNENLNDIGNGRRNPGDEINAIEQKTYDDKNDDRCDEKFHNQSLHDYGIKIQYCYEQWYYFWISVADIWWGAE